MFPPENLEEFREQAILALTSGVLYHPHTGDLLSSLDEICDALALYQIRPTETLTATQRWVGRYLCDIIETHHHEHSIPEV